VTQALPVSGPGLAVLQLYDNQLTGSLPASWSNLVSLTQLLLNGNRLQGPIPPSWAFGMTALNTLSVGGNVSGVCGSNPGGVLWPKNQTDFPPLPPCSSAGPYPPPLSPPPAPSPRALQPSPPLPPLRPLAQQPPAPLPPPAAPPLPPPLVSPAPSQSSPSPPQGMDVSPAYPPTAATPQVPGTAQGADRSTSSSFKPWWIAVIVASILSALLLLLLIVAVLRLWRRRRQRQRQRSQSYALGPAEIPPSSPPQLPRGVAGAAAPSYPASPLPAPPVSSRLSRAPSAAPLAAAPPEAAPSGLDRPSMYAQYNNPVFAGNEHAGGVANWQDVMSALYLVEQEGYDPTSPATPLQPLQPAPSSPGPLQHSQPVGMSTPPAALAAPAFPNYLPRRQGSDPSPDAGGGAVRAGGPPRSMPARMAPGGPSASSQNPTATRTKSLPAPYRPGRT
ncbi:hypothetical protein Vafri_14147, partial [Volvox africanus]